MQSAYMQVQVEELQPGPESLGGVGVVFPVGESTESESERGNGSLSTHERRGWREGRKNGVQAGPRYHSR